MFRQFLIPSFMLLFSSFALTSCIETAVGLGTAAVAAPATEKGFSTTVSDTVIKGKLVDKFIKTDVALLTNIETAVTNGEVRLTGDVSNIEHKSLATKLSWEIKGVKSVINELQIGKRTFRQTAKDKAAEAQLLQRLIADQNVTSMNFSWDVVNGIVYISGIAENAEERDRVLALADSLKWASKVHDYIVLSTDQRD